MTKQPRALRLADDLEAKDFPPRRAAAAELRRLHEVNAELMEAAQAMLAVYYDMERNDETLAAVKKTMKAVYKATGGQ
jgi:hypothetical protein